MKNLIQMNKFSELHDDERIVFCKIDHVMNEFERVSSLPHEVVMLIMNGDFSFTESKLNYKPHNVKHIFATNSTVYNDIVTPIPLGVENAIEISFKALDENPNKRIFLLIQMIHNPDVNRDLLSRGVQFLQDTEGNQLIPFEEVSSDDVVIIPAFGAPLDIIDLLESKKTFESQLFLNLKIF